jgi:energy-coupling factor transporter ATP-binding protein EcfA2
LALEDICSAPKPTGMLRGVIERVRLLRYKGFEDFDLRIGRQAVIVGPNNAGKTTLVHALRLTSGLLKYARRRNVSDSFEDTDLDKDPRKVLGYPLSSVGARELSWYKDENLRHEFRDLSTGLEVDFNSKARLRVLWPTDSNAFFYIEKLPGIFARTPAVVRACTPDVSIVPTLLPVEDSEELLTAQYVRESIGTRRTSRHFRNQLYYLREESQEQFDDFVAFAVTNTPEITGLSLTVAYASGVQLDLYVVEAATNKEREIYWLGDGLQIWLQVLLFIWLGKDSATLILDEPDVFLHPDLQRRLVNILDDFENQVILATHAPEIIAESNKNSIVWVDRTRRRSRRAANPATLSQLNSVLGSGFNLGLARALRSRVALFVEGDDMKILRNVARAVGAGQVRNERGLAVVQLGGFSNWHQAEPFGWLSRDLLGDAVKIFVILDRDYRSDKVIDELTSALAASHIHTHVWRRKELESYLLVPEAISRASGLSLEIAASMLDSAIEETRLNAQASFVARRQRDAERGVDPKTVMLSALPEFEDGWADPAKRVGLAPPKEVFSTLAEAAQKISNRPISGRSVSAVIRDAEVPSEMADLICEIEAVLLTPI